MFVTVHLPRFKIIEHKWLIGLRKKLEKCAGMSLEFRKLNDFITSVRISPVTSTMSMHLLTQTSSSISMTYFYFITTILIIKYVHTYIVYLGVHMLCVHIYIHMCIHIYIYPHIYVLIRTYLNSYMHTCFFFVGDNYITNGKPKCYLKPHKIGPLVIVKLVISF